MHDKKRTEKSIKIFILVSFSNILHDIIQKIFLSSCFYWIFTVWLQETYKKISFDLFCPWKIMVFEYTYFERWLVFCSFSTADRILNKVNHVHLESY